MRAWLKAKRRDEAHAGVLGAAGISKLLRGLRAPTRILFGTRVSVAGGRLGCLMRLFPSG